MALTNAYLTVDEMRDLLRDQLVGHEGEYERCILAASRVIDEYCGRHFWKSATAEARTFRPKQTDLVWTGDIATTTGLIVKTDDNQDGTYETTWTINTHFILEPFERINGMPYERIAAVGSLLFPVPGINSYNPSVARTSLSRRPLVQVTAFWGWASVPDNVKMATAIQAMDNFRAKDLAHVASTYGNEVRVARDYSPGNAGRKVAFSRTRSPMLNPQAEALVSGLRNTVIA